MINIITKKYEDTVALKMSGRLTPEDYDLIIPLIENKIRNYGKINLYCEVEDIESMKPGAIWQDLKFDVQHFNDFKRVAIVGDREWLEWMSKFAKPFTSSEIKFFNENEKAQAMDWVVMGRKETHEA